MQPVGQPCEDEAKQPAGADCEVMLRRVQGARLAYGGGTLEAAPELTGPAPTNPNSHGINGGGAALTAHHVVGARSPLLEQLDAVQQAAMQHYMPQVAAPAVCGTTCVTCGPAASVSADTACQPTSRRCASAGGGMGWRSCTPASTGALRNATSCAPALSSVPSLSAYPAPLARFAGTCRCIGGKEAGLPPSPLPLISLLTLPLFHTPDWHCLLRPPVKHSRVTLNLIHPKPSTPETLK